MRSICAAVCFLLVSIPCAAQGSAFGLGARLSMVRSDAHSDLDPVRFTGGQIRLRGSSRTGFEVSLDVHSQSNEALTQRVRDVPLQASLLLFPVKSAFSPYLLGGPGWYSHRVQSLAGGDVVDSETTRKFGWHGGLGAELRLGRHAGVHGDYRYTFLHFGSNDDEDTKDSGSRFLPHYDGSMWTAGVTVYF
jgi:outer membrane protein with beta-barrel domain